jgi:hypothetical protein
MYTYTPHPPINWCAQFPFTVSTGSWTKRTAMGRLCGWIKASVRKAHPGATASPSGSLARSDSSELPCGISPPLRLPGCLAQSDTSELPCSVSPPPRLSGCLARSDSSEPPCSGTDTLRKLSDVNEKGGVHVSHPLLRELPRRAWLRWTLQEGLDRKSAHQFQHMPGRIRRTHGVRTHTPGY